MGPYYGINFRRQQFMLMFQVQIVADDTLCRKYCLYHWNHRRHYILQEKLTGIYCHRRCIYLSIFRGLITMSYLPMYGCYEWQHPLGRRAVSIFLLFHLCQCNLSVIWIVSCCRDRYIVLKYLSINTEIIAVLGRKEENIVPLTNKLSMQVSVKVPGRIPLQKCYHFYLNRYFTIFSWENRPMRSEKKKNMCQ